MKWYWLTVGNNGSPQFKPVVSISQHCNEDMKISDETGKNFPFQNWVSSTGYPESYMLFPQVKVSETLCKWANMKP